VAARSSSYPRSRSRRRTSARRHGSLLSLADFFVLRTTMSSSWRSTRMTRSRTSSASPKDHRTSPYKEKREPVYIIAASCIGCWLSVLYTYINFCHEGSAKQDRRSRIVGFGYPILAVRAPPSSYCRMNEVDRVYQLNSQRRSKAFELKIYGIFCVCTWGACVDEVLTEIASGSFDTRLLYGMVARPRTCQCVDDDISNSVA
jgi:hypothetical protein